MKKIRIALFSLLAAGDLIAAQASASSLAPTESALSLASQEGALLHLKLGFTGVEVLKAGTSHWQPLPPPRDKVLLVNLWTKSCEPCKRELPALAALYEEWKQNSKVAFLFIAEAPMSRVEVAEFWSNPFLPADSEDRCPELGMQLVRGPSGSRCLLPHIDSDPVRSKDGRLRELLHTSTQPLTLLLDSALVVRQAWVGSLGPRQHEVSLAIDRVVSLGRGH